VRDKETIDSEPRLLAAVRRVCREQDGVLPSIGPVDELLDERRELDRTPGAKLTAQSAFVHKVCLSVVVAQHVWCGYLSGPLQPPTKEPAMSRLFRFMRLPSSLGNTVRSMKISIGGLATTLLVSGCFGLAGLELGAGTAHADDRYGPHQWCPGQSMEWPTGPWNQVDWDMNVCHTWYVVGIGQGNVPERSGGPSYN